MCVATSVWLGVSVVYRESVVEVFALLKFLGARIRWKDPPLGRNRAWQMSDYMSMSSSNMRSKHLSVHGDTATVCCWTAYDLPLRTITERSITWVITGSAERAVREQPSKAQHELIRGIPDTLLLVQFEISISASV